MYWFFQTCQLLALQGCGKKIEMTYTPKNILNQTWPACVGLSKSGRFGRVHTVWNDPDNCSKPTPWWMRLFPMKWIKWDRDGAYIIKIKI